MISKMGMSISGNTIDTTTSLLLLHINIRFYFLPLASFHSCIPIEIHESNSRIRCDDGEDVDVDVDVLHHTKKNKKIDTVGKCYYIPNQVNGISN